MDAITKKLSVNEAQKLVHKLINNGKITEIENLWIPELDSCHLTIKDSETLNRIFELKNDKTEPSVSLYNNCIKEGIITDLLKKNWRRLFNNDIIDKYYIYVNNKNYITLTKHETRKCIGDVTTPTKH